jgi:hypothetical protein
MGVGGRTVRVHPQEALLQAARARQASPAGRADRVRRQAVEHRIARLVPLGIRQARYRGRTKTLFQLLLAAAVANLTLLANTATEGSNGAIIAGACFALLAVLLVPRSHPDSPEGPNPEVRWLAPRAVGAALLPASTWPRTFTTAPSRPGF